MTLQDTLNKAKSELRRYEYLSGENPNNKTYELMVVYWINTVQALERMSERT